MVYSINLTKYDEIWASVTAIGQERGVEMRVPYQYSADLTIV